MALQQCKNGHYYNDSESATCPICSGDSPIGHTIPLGADAATPANMAQTEILSDPVLSGQNAFIPTVAPGADDTFGTTQFIDGDKNSEILPVRGWLVVIEGKKRGLDFKIHSGNNVIGRSKKNDICIDFDSTISKENACSIRFDDRKNAFHIVVGESTNNVYVNDDVLLAHEKLTDNAIIEIGETKLVFRSLCNDTFTY